MSSTLAKKRELQAHRMVTPMRSAVLKLVSPLALVVSLLACCAEAPVEPTYPPGVILTVTADTTVHVTADEVESVAKKLTFAFPGGTDMHFKRLALREVVLPRAAIRAGNEEARTEALERAMQIGSELEDGFAHENERVSTGDVDSLGALVVGNMLDLPVGEWSELTENFGTFQFIRVIKHATPEFPKVSLAIVNVPYARELTSAEDIERYEEESVLEVIDDGYGDLIPVLSKHRMSAKKE